MLRLNADMESESICNWIVKDNRPKLQLTLKIVSSAKQLQVNVALHTHTLQYLIVVLLLQWFVLSSQLRNRSSIWTIGRIRCFATMFNNIPKKMCIDFDRLQHNNIDKPKARKVPKLKWHTHNPKVFWKKCGLFCLFCASTSWLVRLGAYKFHFSNDLHDWMQLFAVIYDAYFIYSNIIDNRQGPQYTAHSNLWNWLWILFCFSFFLCAFAVLFRFCLRLLPYFTLRTKAASFILNEILLISVVSAVFLLLSIDCLQFCCCCNCLFLPSMRILFSNPSQTLCVLSIFNALKLQSDGS